MGGSPALDDPKLHILFFPFLSSGHLIPQLDIARLLADRNGVKVSYVTTAGNAHRVSEAIDDASERGRDIQLLLLPFPSDDVGLPAGCESTDTIPMSEGTLEKFYNLVQKLQGPLEQLIRERRPDCLVGDEMYPWTADLAASVGIPRIRYIGTCHFTLCVSDEIEYQETHLSVTGDDEPFLVPRIPHKIQFTRAELPKVFHYAKFVLDWYRDSERKSYGTMMNSFDELAPEYVDILKDGGRRKVWNVGPVASRASKRGGGGGGQQSSNDAETKIKNWLDEKQVGSVLYVAFGTECILSNEQLREISVGLESSGRSFVWTVRGRGGGLDTIGEWLPAGLEDRVKGRGLILKGWAPQLLILNHPAVGGFLSHCGWNSTSEALTAGVPIIAWPLQSEQFINERLVVQVLGTAVSALEGARRTICVDHKGIVGAEAVVRVVNQVMGGGKESEELKQRAKKYKELARSAVEEGGSSYVNLSCMIEELSGLAKDRRRAEKQIESA